MTYATESLERKNIWDSETKYWANLKPCCAAVTAAISLPALSSLLNLSFTLNYIIKIGKV